MPEVTGTAAVVFSSKEAIAEANAPLPPTLVMTVGIGSSIAVAPSPLVVLHPY
jgi:hypothetical protein